jgi:hypothetical protein
VVVDDSPYTLYEQFVADNDPPFGTELMNFDDRLRAIGNDTGIISEFFKTGLGRRDQHICQFYDRPKAKMRLFFIEEMSRNMIIVGGGGLKPKNLRATEDDSELNTQRELLMKIEDILRKAEKDGTLIIHIDGSITSTTDNIYYFED